MTTPWLVTTRLSSEKTQPRSADPPPSTSAQAWTTALAVNTSPAPTTATSLLASSKSSLTTPTYFYCFEKKKLPFTSVQELLRREAHDPSMPDEKCTMFNVQ